MSQTLGLPLVKFMHPSTGAPCIALQWGDRFYYDLDQLSPGRIESVHEHGAELVRAKDVRLVSDVNSGLMTATQAALEAGGTHLTELVGMSALDGSNAVTAHFSEADRTHSTMTALRDFILLTLRNGQTPSTGAVHG